MELKTIYGVGEKMTCYIKKKLSILMIAFMLGMSNVILEETRMINDTRPEIELQELQEEDSIL